MNEKSVGVVEGDAEFIAELERFRDRCLFESVDGSDAGEIMDWVIDHIKKRQNGFRQLAESWYVAVNQVHDLQLQQIASLNRDPTELYDCLQCVQDHEISVAKAVENVRFWLCGQPFELPEKAIGK